MCCASACRHRDSRATRIERERHTQRQRRKKNGNIMFVSLLSLCLVTVCAAQLTDIETDIEQKYPFTTGLTSLSMTRGQQREPSAVIAKLDQASPLPLPRWLLSSLASSGQQHVAATAWMEYPHAVTALLSKHFLDVVKLTRRHGASQPGGCGCMFSRSSWERFCRLSGGSGQLHVRLHMYSLTQNY